MRSLSKWFALALLAACPASALAQVAQQGQSVVYSTKKWNGSTITRNAVVLNITGGTNIADLYVLYQPDDFIASTGPFVVQQVQYDTTTSGVPASGKWTLNHNPSVGPAGVFNAKNFGAVGDGSTDDTAALQAGILAAGGHALYLPQGTYVVSSTLTLQAQSASIVGESRTGTIIQAKAGLVAPMIQSAGFANEQGTILSNLTLDSGNTASAAALIIGYANQRVRIENVDVVNFGLGLNLSGVSDLDVVGCRFYGKSQTNTTAINMAGGISNVRVLNSEFLWVTNGVLVGTSGGLADHVQVLNSYFDLGWWLRTFQLANSGGTVSYSASQLIDSSASFTIGAIPNGTTIRAMTSAHAGTVTLANTNNNQLGDSSALFTTYGVLPGQIVTLGTSLFAVVSGVIDDTHLAIEGWLDYNTRMPAALPTNGQAYTLWSLKLGKSTGVPDSTHVNVDHWYTLDGTTSTPAAATRYEIVNQSPNYPIHMEAGASFAVIQGNVVRRGWSDQISYYGEQGTISNNTVEDGQDVGITVNGTLGRQLIANNNIRHQGTWGVYSTGPQALIVGNHVTATTWTNSINTTQLGGILAAGNNSFVASNYVNGESAPLARYGIITNASNATVQGNYLGGHSVADVWTIGTPTGNQYINNTGTTGYDTGASGQFTNGLTGSGTPETFRTAAPGSLYFDTTNGEMYIKKTGTGNTGWKLVTHA